MVQKTQQFMFDLPNLVGEDFAEHNKESSHIWEVFKNRSHKRVPIRLNSNPRMLMLDPHYNTRGITYEEYMTDPDVMAQAILEWQYWTRFLLPGDHEKGLPRHWAMGIDFENHYDAAWFGCPIHYRDWQVPDHEPILRDGNKRMLFDRGIPDPFGGEWAERALQFYEHYEKKRKKGWMFLGVPVAPPDVPTADPDIPPFENCDGLFTIAACLRGPTGLCLDLATDPD